MSKFVYYTNDGSVTGNPVSATDYYNYLKGIWIDGTLMTYGGNGHRAGTGATTDTCDFMFPGNSDPYGWGTHGKIEAPWDEMTAGDETRRQKVSNVHGLFTMRPGAVYCIKVGLPWARIRQGT